MSEQDSEQDISVIKTPPKFLIRPLIPLLKEAKRGSLISEGVIFETTGCKFDRILPAIQRWLDYNRDITSGKRTTYLKGKDGSLIRDSNGKMIGTPNVYLLTNEEQAMEPRKQTIGAQRKVVRGIHRGIGVDREKLTDEQNNNLNRHLRVSVKQAEQLAHAKLEMDLQLTEGERTPGERKPPLLPGQKPEPEDDTEC